MNKWYSPAFKNDSPANSKSKWTLMADRSLNMSLSRLVEPFHLFHPTSLLLRTITVVF